jgi:hypothetical protein
MSAALIDSGAIFVGIARDVRPYVSDVLANVGHCAECFADKKILLVENDSVDGTQEILYRWAATADRYIYIRADNNLPPDLEKTERLAHFRNIYLREIEKDEYREFEYVVVFDCDNVNSTWIDRAAFIDAVRFLAAEEQHAAVFANTRGFYYDIWSLRHPVWCAGDCWNDVELLKAFTSDAMLSCVGARQIQIRPTSAPIPLTSAFGGLAIYKRRFLLGKRHSGRKCDGPIICEHVPVNESIAADGGKLFIFPPLQVSTPYEHIYRARDKLYYRTRIYERLREMRRRWRWFFLRHRLPRPHQDVEH